MSFLFSGRGGHFSAGCVLWCALVGAAAAQADTTPPTLAAASATAPTLAQAVDAAWLRATQAREAAGQVTRAQADKAAASSLWPAPPALELSHRDDRWQTSAGRRETEAGLSWPLWLPGQRQARNAAADADLELAQAATSAGRLHYAGLVREAAWAITGQRLEADLAETQTRYLQQLADDVDRRVKAGDLAHADALAARSEVLASQSAMLGMRQRQTASEAQWTTLTGLVQVPRLFWQEYKSDTEVNQATAASIEDHPDNRVAALSAQRARKRLDAVAVTRREPTELLLRIRQDTPGRGEQAQNSIGIGVRIPLGTAGRNLPLQAAALSELDVAQTAELRTTERLAAEVAMAQAAIRSAEQQLDAERQRTALLRERADLISQSFKAGETPLPELLRALSAAAQADTSLARQQVTLGLAHARLQQAFGTLP